MRVLHLLHQYLPDQIGGVELHTQAVAQQLVRLGHDVSLFFRRNAGGTGLDRWNDGGVRVYAARAGEIYPTNRFFATFRQPPLVELFAEVLEEEQPELVHIQHLMGLPLEILSCLQQNQIPYVVTLHDYWWGCANAQLLTNDTAEICKGPQMWINCGRCALARAGISQTWLAPAVAPLFGLRHLWLRDALRNSKRLIAPTHFAVEMYHRMGFSMEAAKVIPHGILLPSSPPPTAVVATSQLNAAYVGGIAPQKGVHVLVEAVNQIPASQVQLSIFGDMDAFPDYAEELRRQAGLPNIKFEGSVANEELLARLPNFDVLAVPSLWYETAALVIQEAFAVRLPVIASDIGALRERVRHEVDGLLVPPGDPTALATALRRLHDEPELLEALQEGISPVRTIEEQVAEIEHVYQEATSYDSEI